MEKQGEFERQVTSAGHSTKVPSPSWPFDAANAAGTLHMLTLQKCLWRLTEWVAFRGSGNVFKIVWKLGAGGLSVSFFLLTSSWNCPCYPFFMLKEQECSKLPCCTVQCRCWKPLPPAPHLPSVGACACEAWVPRYRDGRRHGRALVGSCAKQKSKGKGGWETDKRDFPLLRQAAQLFG